MLNLNRCLRVILLFTLLPFFGFSSSSLGCEDPTCPFAEAGYRRYGVQVPQIVHSDQPSHEFFDYFKTISDAGRHLREVLLRNGALKKPQQQANVDPSSTNVASFGFVFFDRDGQQINKKPFHFSPCVTQETLEEPFFFLSGRCQRKYSDKQDPHPWASLPESAPKQQDLRLRATQQIYKQGKAPPEIKKTFRNVLTDLEIPMLRNLQYLMERTHKGYSEAVDAALIKKAQQIPFFDFIHNRYKRLEEDNGIHPDNTIMCEQLLETLSLQGTRLKRICFYPDENKEATGNNPEGDFTHSEQYALFHMSHTFPSFIDTCFKMIKPSDAPFPDITSYAVLIFSTNVMCIRCAQSMIMDFIHPADSEENYSLNGIIESQLAEALGYRTPLLPIFLAGYLSRYASVLHGNQRPDQFEAFMLDSVGEEPCVPTLSIERLEEEIGKEKTVIYHYHIPSNQKDEEGSVSFEEESSSDFGGGLFEVFGDENKTAEGVGSTEGAQSREDAGVPSPTGAAKAAETGAETTSLLPSMKEGEGKQAAQEGGTSSPATSDSSSWGTS